MWQPYHCRTTTIIYSVALFRVPNRKKTYSEVRASGNTTYGRFRDITRDECGECENRTARIFFFPKRLLNVGVNLRLQPVNRRFMLTYRYLADCQYTSFPDTLLTKKIITPQKRFSAVFACLRPVRIPRRGPALEWRTGATSYSKNCFARAHTFDIPTRHLGCSYVIL